jgi:N-acetylmuramoyl-L-alanine amidase
MMPGPYTHVILRGDYTSDTALERQQMALQQGCVAVVDVHFNSAESSNASGGEVHFQSTAALTSESRRFAEQMWERLALTGLPPHGSNPVRSTNEAPRSAFINSYLMPTVLLEPLFISNREQADWLHQRNNVQLLANAINEAIRFTFPRGGLFGLSPGHVFKTSSPDDPGAGCARLDHERDHTLPVVEAVANLL